MDPELKKMVEESLHLSRENNKILRSMRNSLRWGKVFRTFYWIIIIGSMLGAYYYFQPFLKIIAKQYQASASFLDQLQKGVSLDQLLNPTSSSPQIKK